MRLSNDLREVLESLNSRGIDYVIVGAHSLEAVSGFKNRFVGRFCETPIEVPQEGV